MENKERLLELDKKLGQKQEEHKKLMLEVADIFEEIGEINKDNSFQALVSLAREILKSQPIK